MALFGRFDGQSPFDSFPFFSPFSSMRSEMQRMDRMHQQFMQNAFGGSAMFSDPFFSNDPFFSQEGWPHQQQHQQQQQIEAYSHENPERQSSVVIEEIASDDEGTQNTDATTVHRVEEHQDDDDDEEDDKHSIQLEKTHPGTKNRHQSSMLMTNNEPKQASQYQRDLSRRAPTTTYSHSSTTYYCSGGPPIVKQQASTATRRGDVYERKSVYSDSQSGVEKAAHVRGLGDRAVQDLRERIGSGEQRRTHQFKNMDKKTLSTFDKEWNDRNHGQTSLPNPMLSAGTPSVQATADSTSMRALPMYRRSSGARPSDHSITRSMASRP